MQTDPPIPKHPPASDAAAAGDEPRTCENCGHDVVGAYCAACGQKGVPFRRPLHHLGREVVGEYFGFDGKLWRTIRPLLTQPGFLTCEYLDGRRNRYVRPVRLYLTASVVLFFLLSVLPGGSFLGGAVQVGDASAVAADSLGPVAAALATVEAEIADIDEEIAELDTTRAALLVARDSLRTLVAAGQTAARPPQPAASGGVGEAGGDGEADFWDDFGETMGRKGGRLGEMGEEGARRWFIDTFTSNMPKAMFVLLPLFAFLLKLLYARRERYYGEHLVFALHTHAFAFFAFAALALFVSVTGEAESYEGWARAAVGAVVLVLVLSVPVYILVALKRVYGQGWVKTVLKWGVLMSAYNFALALGIVAIVILAVLLL